MNRGEPSSSPAEPVHSITGAASPHSDDLDARIHRYLISMSVRVLCVLLAIFVHAQWRHWSWWIFAIGAIILPYVAVVMANSVNRKRGGPEPAPIAPPTLRSLPSAGPTRAVVNEDVTVTIHPPRRRVDDDSPDSPRSEPTFVPDGPAAGPDSRSSSEQST